MKWHELKKLIAVVFALGVVAAACGGSSGSEGASTTAQSDGSTPVTAEGEVNTPVTEAPAGTVITTGGTVTHGLEAESTGLRPWDDSCAVSCYNIERAIFDTLLEQAEDGTFQPFLATDITPSDDLTVWVMNLRPGIKFHNGVELTAQTIADEFPLQQAGTAGSSAINSSGLVSVEATGPLEVTYTLSAPNSAFPAQLNTNGLGMVFEPAAAAADPEGFSLAPIGTGPFTISKRDIDNETVVVRNPDYWGKDPEGNQLPYLDSIVFRPTPDEGTRLDSVVSGTTNSMETLRQGTIRDARAASNDGSTLTLYEAQGNNAGGGMFNIAKAPYDDVRVRQGLTLMNNQEQVIEALGGTGISLPATQMFSADSPWWSQKAADAYLTFDYAAGKAKVQEYVDDPARSDGKAVGEKIDVELSCPPDPTLIAAMQVLEQAWTGSELVNVNLTQFDQATHINNAVGSPADNFTGVHGAHCWRWGTESDPSLAFNPFVGPPFAADAESVGLPATAISPGNVANWWCEQCYKDAQSAIQTTDFEKRKALYEAISIQINEQVPIWFSGGTATAAVTAPDVKGYNSWHLPDGTLGIGHPGVYLRWQEVWIDTNA
jgi:peptide/nickel transport system substrate-binding protein